MTKKIIVSEFVHDQAKHHHRELSQIRKSLTKTISFGIFPILILSFLLASCAVNPHNNAGSSASSQNDTSNVSGIESSKKEIILPDPPYDGTDPIEKLVYETELEREQSAGYRGFHIIVPKIFGSYEQEHKLKVFVTTFSTTYQLWGNELSVHGIGAIPAAISYQKLDDGTYYLEKFEQAKDGSLYASSIHDYCTMPVSGEKIPGLAEQILNYSGNDAMTKLGYERLAKHLINNGQTDAVLYLPDDELVFSLKDYL